MFRKQWYVPGDSLKQDELDSLLDDLYPNGTKDKKQLFTDPKSKLRLQLALDGCTPSMVFLAKKLFEENPVTDGIAMEVAFRWLLKAARAGDEAAIAMLGHKRRYCPPLLAPFVDSALEKNYCEKERATSYSKRIAARFKKTYEHVDEEVVSSEIYKVVSGEMPTCESVFSRCFTNVFGDLFALGVTLVLGGFIGHLYLSSFDHLLSAKLAPMMDAFFAFLCTILLIVSIRVYSTIFTCGMYAKAMDLDAKYRDCPLPFRLRMFWTRLKLHAMALFCVVFMIVLSVLSYSKVSLTVFSCTTYMITLVDLIYHIHWWYTSGRTPDQYVGRYPLLLKFISAVCMFCLFSFTKAEIQDAIITLSMTIVGCSVIYLWSGCSVFTFSFLTSEYSLILQGLSVIKTLLFLINRQLFLRIPRSIKSLLIIVIIVLVVQSVPSGLLFHPKDTSSSEIYNLCHSTSTTKEMIACSRLEGRRINATAYIESTRLLSRSNLQEAAGLENASLNDGFVKMEVDSFEKIKVEVKLSTNYFTATAVLDDDALSVVRSLTTGQYITVDGVIETARVGPEIRLTVHCVEYKGQYLEVKRLGTAMRQYWRHVHSVLAEWRYRIDQLTSRTDEQQQRHSEL